MLACAYPLYYFSFSFFPAYSAGLGVLNMAIQALSRMSGNNEMAAKNQCYLLDKDVKHHTFLYDCTICDIFSDMPSGLYP